jgi:transcriptional regulator
MYNPKHFSQTDRLVIVDTIRQLGAADVITYGSDGIDASFLPLLIDDAATVLRGHFARANRQWKRVDVSVPALVSWRGPDTYISPSLYPTKAETGKVVPTWNYIAIQARGTIVIHDDPLWVEDLVRSLTDVHEATQTVPWSVDDAPRDYLDSMIAGIVGVEVRITSLEAKWKLSQNKSEADIAGIRDGLRESDARGAQAIAVAVDVAVDVAMRHEVTPG